MVRRETVLRVTLRATRIPSKRQPERALMFDMTLCARWCELLLRLMHRSVMTREARLIGHLAAERRLLRMTRRAISGKHGVRMRQRTRVERLLFPREPQPTQRDRR